MGWFSVVYDPTPTGSNAVEDQCATLLSTAPTSVSISGKSLNKLLQLDPGLNRYQEGAQRLPVFRVDAYYPGPGTTPPADPSTIEIVLAYRKTLKRTKPNVSTISDPTSKPQRRWWGLCIGCRKATQPGPDLYPIIKPQVVAFYCARNISIDERLVIVRCSKWTPDPNVEIDHLYQQMQADPQITLVTDTPETAYPPFDKCCTSGLIQITHITYSGPCP